jgi:uncharacterized protein
MSSAAAISPSERILTLDIIRGVALLGIFIMNMPGFNTPRRPGGADPLWPDWWDRTAEVARDVLFSGKFNSMFSMLFAIGFIIMLERLEARDPERATAIYLRRLGWLFVFGVIHTTVFWHGDVLHMYALLGLVLLALRRVPEKALWVLFGLCFLYPVAIGIYRVATTTPEQVQAFRAVLEQFEVSNNAAYGAGTFFEAAREHTRDTWFDYSNPIRLLVMLGFYVQFFSTMLLGLILGRRRFFQSSEAHLPLVRRVQWWALGVGVASGALYGYYEARFGFPRPTTPFAVLANVAYSICRVSTMVFYVATIVRAVHHTKWRRRLEPLASAGRMPLTNYLMQTAIATFIFYGWGLGFWGQVGPALDLVLAFAIFFLVQMPLSRWWLRHFDTGPLEYLWRRLTYGHATLRRAAPSRA